jgi:hypothetical protein
MCKRASTHSGARCNVESRGSIASYCVRYTAAVCIHIDHRCRRARYQYSNQPRTEPAVSAGNDAVIVCLLSFVSLLCDGAIGLCNMRAQTGTGTRSEQLAGALPLWARTCKGRELVELAGRRCDGCGAALLRDDA